MWKVLKQKSYRRKVFLIKNCYRREKSKQNTCFYVFKIIFLSCVVLKWPLPGRSNAIFSFAEVIFEDFLIIVSNSMTLLRTFIAAVKHHSHIVENGSTWSISLRSAPATIVRLSFRNVELGLNTDINELVGLALEHLLPLGPLAQLRIDLKFRIFFLFNQSYVD